MAFCIACYYRSFMKKLLSVGALLIAPMGAHAEVLPVWTPSPILMPKSPLFNGLSTVDVDRSAFEHFADVITPPSSILIPKTTRSSDTLDVTVIEEFVTQVSPNARHYPPNFPNRTAQYHTQQNIKRIADWLEPYATAPNASFELLLLSAKVNAMGRNLDLGSEYGVRASTYIGNALKLNPNHPEANFLYGMMLSEGGGFKEGQKYLKKAAQSGYLEAEQSLAQAQLLNDDRDSALSSLQTLAKQYPDNAVLKQQIAIIEEGGYYIWDIKNNALRVKPIILPN